MLVILELNIGSNLNQMISRIVVYRSGKSTGIVTESNLVDMYLNKTLVPRALKLLSLNPVSRSTNLVTSFPDNDKGLRSILEEAASRVREARSSYLVSRTDSLDKC
jgi:hypothetical protein